MLPVLQLGPLALQTDLLLLLIAGWAGLATGARVAPHLGVDGDHIYNAGLYAFLAAIVAGRLGHVVAFWPAYRLEPLVIIGINARAFLLWPAVLAALAVFVAYVARQHLPWPRVLDAGAAGALLALAIADLANLAAGRALGAPASVPWAISIFGVRRHPSQLYEMLATLAVLPAVLWVLKRAYVPGRVAWVAILGYGLVRWLLEPFREQSATLLGGLRTAQVLGLVLILLALWALLPRSGGEPSTGAR